MSDDSIRNHLDSLHDEAITYQETPAGVFHVRVNKERALEINTAQHSLDIYPPYSDAARKLSGVIGECLGFEPHDHKLKEYHATIIYAGEEGACD